MKKRFLIASGLLIIASIAFSQTSKILYVDEFDKICGIPVQEDSLIKLVTHNGFNSLYLYDLNTVTQNKAGKNSLSLFIERCHSLKIKCVGVAGKLDYINSDLVNSRKSYQDSQTDLNKRLDGINLESEFWRYPRDGTPTFPDWINTLESMQAYCSQTGITGNFYMGQLNDKQNKFNDNQIANFMLQNTKQVLLSNYVTTSQFTDDPVHYVKNRLSTLGTEAKKQNKYVDIVIIFSGTADYMHKYFKTSTINDAYSAFMARYNNINFQGKSNIKITGYACYSYQEIRYCKTFN